MENTISKDKIIQKAKIYHEQYKDYIPAAFFTLGFSFDLVTLGEIDDLMNIIIQAIYLIIAGHILYLEFNPLKEIKNKYFKYYLEYKEDIYHFLLGSLLSAFTIFYFKSSSMANSFIFLTFLASILLLNESTLFKKLGSIVQSSLYMLCLLSYLLYVIPVLFGKTGFLYFILSSILAILFMSLKVVILRRKELNQNEIFKQLVIPQISVVLIFLILYLFKVIPPVPLSLKHIGIYHHVQKERNSYITSSNKKWYDFYSSGDQNFRYREGDKIYVFTKVFAPAGFEGKVYIHWLKETDDGLHTSDRIALNITGGRREGFRGYAYKANYSPGDWQVRIETSNEIEIGRINISIEKDDDIETQRKFKVVKQI